MDLQDGKMEGGCSEWPIRHSQLAGAAFVLFRPSVYLLLGVAPTLFPLVASHAALVTSAICETGSTPNDFRN